MRPGRRWVGLNYGVLPYGRSFDLALAYGGPQSSYSCSAAKGKISDIMGDVAKGIKIVQKKAWLKTMKKRIFASPASRPFGALTIKFVSDPAKVSETRKVG